MGGSDSGEDFADGSAELASSSSQRDSSLPAEQQWRYSAEEGGKVIMSGWLVKEGKTTKLHKPRFLSLEDGKLDNKKDPKAKPTWTVSIKNCAVGPGPRLHELVVNLPKRKASFFAASRQDFEKWIIALKKASASNFNLDAFYRVGDVIGEGVNGEVHIGWDRVTNEAVAIKSIPYEGDMSKANDSEAEQEIRIVKSLNHPALVRTYDVFRDEDEKRVYMVMEYVRGGELFARVANETGTLVKESDAVRIARDLLGAVVYLHEKNIVHRDVKLENILCLNEDKAVPIHVKLADFGLSSNLTGKERSLQSLVGTSFYLAPEIISQEGYGSSVDAWAVGVVFYIMLSGQFPFCGENDEEYYENVLKQPLEFPSAEWSHIDEDAIDLISKLLEKDPKKRATPQEALNHKWLNDESVGFVREEVELLKLESEAEEGLAPPKSFRLGRRKTPAQLLARLDTADK